MRRRSRHAAGAGRADIAPYVQAFRDDRELGRLLGIEEDPDEAALAERLAKLDGFREQGRFIEVAIADAATGAFVGSLTLHSFDWQSRRGELGFWIVPAARRRGFVRSAVALALGWMFGELDLDRVELTTTPDNEAVTQLATALGLVREGVLRSRNLERGKRVDVVMFGLLREEWRA